MRMHHTFIVATLLLRAAASAAMPPNGLQPPSGPVFGESSRAFRDVPPASAQDTGLLSFLQAHFAGEPVIAVDVATVSRVAPPFRADQKLLSRLQDVVEAYGSTERPLVPYAVRGAWVLAPVSRDEIITDFSTLPAIEATSPMALWTEAIASLTPTQISEICLPNGMAVSALPAAARDRVERALRPPLQLQLASPEGPGVTDETAPTLDPAGLRIRARLRTSQISVVFQTGSGRSAITQTTGVNTRTTPMAPALTSPNSAFGAVLPSVRHVPNTFKASDLDGARYRAPIGVAGEMRVADLLAKASAATNLKMQASSQYQDVKVYVGSANIPVGDVLDGLRLALTASWRRLGDIYFLAWDREGIGPLRERADENGAALRKGINDTANDANNNPVWLQFIQRASFAEDDPFALTPKQMLYVFAEMPAEDAWKPRYVGWADMTAGQRAAATTAIQNREISVPDPKSGQWERRAATPNDVRSAALDGHLQVEFSVLMPGRGWVFVGYGGHSLDRDAVRALRQKRDARPTPPAARAPSPTRSSVSYRRDQPTLRPSRHRAVLTPPLNAAKIGPLADMMSARGFDTLFYPLLTDGLALIPSKAFPTHPAVGSGAGISTVARVMEQHGIKVVGWLNTLAWRKPGQVEHWLSRFPGYMDADILGRPFSASVSALAKANNVAVPFIVGDLVRPDDPAVATRLETLLKEAAATPNLSGVLFDAWSPDTSIVANELYPPQLNWAVTTGFSVAGRLAAIRRDGVDPVDSPIHGNVGDVTDALAVPKPPAVRSQRMEDGRMIPPPPPPASPEYLLLNRLAMITPSAGQAWTTYAVAPSPRPGYRVGYPQNGAGGRPLPVKVVLEAPGTGFGRDTSPLYDICRVVPRGNDQRYGWDTSTPAIVYAERTAFVPPGVPPLNLAVYDFRLAPDEIMDSLRRVGLPPPVEEAGLPTSGVGQGVRSVR